ncbi:MAG: DNA primase [Deltaproteobacteria bacterium]|nr:DNA primase [Deltaproteobacteria bacterium]
MALSFSQEKIDEVRQATDIAEVIGRYVSLTQRGERFVGLCPFHPEKTPSFTVNPQMQIFKCFGCGEGGSVFQFLMKHVGLSFPEAVRELAKTYHVPLPRPQASPQEKKQLQAREELLAVCGQAAGYFADRLKSRQGLGARTYLKERGIPDEVTGRFQLGWADDRWDGLLNHFRAQGASPARLKEAGLIMSRRSGTGYYDRFRGRLIFPIQDAAGRVVAFGGRGIEAGVEPKYLNSPETPLFKKGRLLYGFSEAVGDIRRLRRVVVVEGYFDCLSLISAGLAGVVATMGTSLTGQQVRLIRGLGAEPILVYDADEAGFKAATRAQEIFNREAVRARILVLPQGQDPDDFVRQEGLAAFESLLESARPLVAFVIDRILDRPLAAPEAKAEAVRELAPVLGRITEPVEQAAYVQEAARQLGVDEKTVLASLSRAGRGVQLFQAFGGEEAATVERGLIAAMVNDPVCGRALVEAGVEEVLADPRHQEVAATVSRFCQKGRDYTPAELMDLLDEEARGLISSRHWPEKPSEDEAYLSELLATVARLRRRRKTAELQRQIEAAQAEGDEERVILLLARKDTLGEQKPLAE